MSPTRIKRAVSSTLIAVTTVVALAIVALLLVPALLGLDRYVITGGSMSGTFERGAIALERQVPVSDLQVGDVITYLPPAGSGISELVTHRIVSITADPEADGGQVFQTQGDANASVDPWTFTLSASVQPRVEGWIPSVGWVFIALSVPGIRMLVIGVPAALIALAYLRDVVRAMRRPNAPTPGAATVAPGATA